MPTGPTAGRGPPPWSSMDIDGLAVVTPRLVRVPVADLIVEIPALPALAWLTPILAERWTWIVPGLVVDDDELVDRLDDGTITVTQCVDAARLAVTATAGLPWWVAVRLAATGTTRLDIAGALALAGVDALRISLAAWCATVYRVVTEHADPKDRGKLDFELERTPPGVAAAERYDPVKAAAAFDRAFAAQR